MYNGKTIGVSVINYNDAQTTINLVNAIRDFKTIDYIIIVDNASTDDSYDNLVRHAFGNVYVVEAEYNGGYGYGNNIAAKFLHDIKVDIIIFSNPDVIFSEVYIKKMVETLTGNVVAASGLMFNNEKILQETVVKNNTYLDDLMECLLLVPPVSRKMQNIKCNTGIYEVEQLNGSLFAVREECFWSIGGFDENVFLYCEERIIGKKIMTKGYKLLINSSACFEHHHSTTINKVLTTNEQIGRLFDSRYYYNKKYNNISGFKLFVLRVAMKYGLFVRRLLSMMRSIYAE